MIINDKQSETMQSSFGNYEEIVVRIQKHDVIFAKKNNKCCIKGGLHYG